MSASLPIPPVLDAAGKAIVDSALKVHTALGPGLIESVYELCLAHELTTRGFDVARQVPLPVVYEGLRLDGGFRLDLLVANGVIVEIKAAEQHNRLFEAQLLTYLRLSGLRLGFLINFNVTQLRQGIKRMVY
ncbi:MAG: GxxExxY protein [Alphaproteobacteria bacterium]|nr:GxxExxY protein [Alphaproteobacteria bacterium]